jgi:hypothetical protein
MLRTTTLVMLLCVTTYWVHGQCNGTGSETDYGAGSWIGYVYEGANNFSTANFKGRITVSENFDSNFCGSADCDFATDACAVTANDFSVRYRMNQTYPTGVYGITIGGDDGVRLSIDGGSSFLIADYSNHSYRTTYTEVVLDGSTDLVLEYYEDGGDSRVSIAISYLGVHWGGQVRGDQMICSSSPFDPDAFASDFPALFSDGSTPSYQWQSSPDDATWTDISGAITEVYDIPSGFSGTLTYYRRQATGGGNIVNSSSLSVYAQVPEGDETSYGDGTWIGYVYGGGADNFTDYRGEIFEAETFDESFGGIDVVSSTSGCDFQTENFTVRFKMQKDFVFGEYDFTVGGDDGYRLSIDGGSSWLIDNYAYHGYATTTVTNQVLDGTYNLVLEYFEGGVSNRVTFDYDLVTPLPVTYLFLTANKHVLGVELSWATVSEKNNHYFEVLRSSTGEYWEVIGHVEGNGTSQEQHHYSYMDKSNPGMVYYRLNQVDFDGQSELSKIILSGDQRYSESFKAYPNPVVDQLSIRWEGRVIDTIEIMDLLGNRVYSDSNNTEIDVSGIAVGMYLIRVIDLSGDVRIQRILVE